MTDIDAEQIPRIEDLPPIKLYKLYNRKINKYLRYGSDSRGSKFGRTWNAINHLTSSLKGTPCFSNDVYVIEITNRSIRMIPIDKFLNKNKQP